MVGTSWLGRRITYQLKAPCGAAVGAYSSTNSAGVLFAGAFISSSKRADLCCAAEKHPDTVKNTIKTKTITLIDFIAGSFCFKYHYDSMTWSGRMYQLTLWQRWQYLPVFIFWPGRLIIKQGAYLTQVLSSVRVKSKQS